MKALLTPRRLAPLLVAALVAVAALFVLRSGPEPMRASVMLPRAVHLYVGSDVVVLGVRVGEITAVRPEGDKVRVDFEYDREQRVPADAQAALVSPTLVADRYLQLLPAYASGPTLPDGGVIPLARGQVPVELDQIVSTLRDLADALGPNGANQKGALADLVSVAADNLEGNGARAGTTLQEVSQLTGTLSDNRQALFDTVENLQLLTTELAERDESVRDFSQGLARVSGQLAGERAQLQAALAALAPALGKVETFVRDNREDLTANVDNLADVAAALAAQQETIGKLLDVAPLGISNFAHLYNPVSMSLTGRINGNDKYESPAHFICSLFSGVGLPTEQCADLLAPFADLPLGGPPPSVAAQSGTPPVQTHVAADPSLAGVLGRGGP